MLVVDLMHEVELGVWKATFIHLIHILNTADPALLNELDYQYHNFLLEFAGIVLTGCLRYRQVPTFGRDTIRKFSSNVSEMRKLAARDFEDLLQVDFLFIYRT